jgi:glycosyltransferase involved in cell wall biosynthesis
MELKAMEQKTFSLVIPVYNVEKYLRQCIESVLHQNYNNYECILVDDGSSDSSGAICDEYARIDDRVRVIHKLNGGLSSARNAGLDIACGKYIFFLDSDDYIIRNDALNDIASIINANNPDVIIFPFIKRFEKSGQLLTNKYIPFELRQMERREWFVTSEYLLTKGLYKASAANKIINHDLLLKFNMRFQVGKFCEDIPWCADILLYCKNFSYYPHPFYVYRQHAQSISKSSPKAIYDAFTFTSDGYRNVQSSNFEDKIIFYAYYASEYTWLLSRQFECNEIKMEHMKSMKKLLNYGLSIKTKMAKMLVDVLGFNFACLFLRNIYILKIRLFNEL